MKKFPFKLSPWMVALEAAMVARRQWQHLDHADQRRLRHLVGKARGGPSAYSPAERNEIKRLVGKLDPVGAGKQLLPVVGRRYRKRR